MWASLVNFVAPEPTPEELLLASIQRGSVELLNEWLRTRGADSLATLSFGGDNDLNLLHVACFHGNLEAVVQLFELGLFALDKPTTLGRNTPAHLAAMNGHTAIVVDFLVSQQGVSLSCRNAKQQNVYDVVPHTFLQLKQTLMTLLLQEENRTGTAPDVGFGTRDRESEAQRLRNLPPPPISVPPSTTIPATTTTAPPPPVHYIQPDGFVTTVGNPLLAAKYGNETQARLHSSSSSSSPQQQFSRSGGVTGPVSRLPPNVQFRPPNSRHINVFTPSPPQQEQ